MPLEVPLKHLAERLLGLVLHDIAVARDHGDEIPLVDTVHALVEALAVLDEVPVCALQPASVARDVLGPREDLVEDAAAGPLRLGHPAVLLRGGQVEEQVGLDEHAVGLVEEDDFQVGVGVDVLVLKVGVEVVADARLALVGLCEDDGEGLVADLGVVLLGSLLRQALGPDELGLGVLLCPLGDEDVVLEVQGDNVAHVAAQLGHLCLDGVCERDGRKDSQSTGREFHYCVTLADNSMHNAGINAYREFLDHQS